MAFARGDYVRVNEKGGANAGRRARILSDGPSNHPLYKDQHDWYFVRVQYKNASGRIESFDLSYRENELDPEPVKAAE